MNQLYSLSAFLKAAFFSEMENERHEGSLRSDLWVKEGFLYSGSIKSNNIFHEQIFIRELSWD